jgi:hypothetical protein
MNRFEQIINLKLNNFEIKYPKKGVTKMEEGGLEDACWEGYKPIGTKILDGREVPNCVPIKEEQAKVKEGFPIPSVEGNEDEDTYISRCISQIIDEYDQDAAYAICKTKWDE